jgi:hypothetical protein
MKILKSQIANILNEIITTTDRSQWDAAYAHSIISGNSTVHHLHANKTLLDSYTPTNAELEQSVLYSHVHTNLSVLDEYNQSNSSISTAVSQTHTHANKSLLDTLSGFTNSSLLSSITDQHSHLNKTLIDSYNQTNAALASAVTNSHTHTNKALLDTLTGFTNTTLLSTISSSHSHSNKATLDTYTQTEANLADAVSKAHAHSNQTLLDSLTSAGAGTSFLANDGTYKVVSSGGVIGGTDTQVLFNDGGVSNGNANLVFNKTTGLTSMLETLVGQKLYVSNSATYISKDVSDNLVFTDSFNTDITLTSLVGGSSTIPANTTGDDIILGRDNLDNWIFFTLADLASDVPNDTFVKWDTVGNYYRFYADKTEAGGAASDAKLYLGIADPDGTTRLNYDGNFHASYFEAYGGIVGYGVDNHAISGFSTNASGVTGTSTNTSGVWGISINNTGVLGTSTSGHAGIFNSESTSLSTVKIYQEANSTANRASALLELSRTNGSTGGYNFTGDLLYINDSVTSTGTVTGRALLYEANSTEKLTLYPRVPNSGSAVAYMLDTVNGLTTTAKLVSVRNAGVEKMSVLQDGSINIPTGATYNINGVPISSGGVTPTDGVFDWVTDKYQPYSTQQASLSFDTSSTDPTLTTRLNINGALYSTSGTFNNITVNNASGKVLTAVNGSTERINLNPIVTDGASAVAYMLDTHNVLSTTGAKLIDFRNQGTSRAWLTHSGTLYTSSTLETSDNVKVGSNTYLYSAGLLQLGNVSFIRPSVVDGATAIAFEINTINTLSTVGAKLASFKNQNTEKIFIDKDGKVNYTAGTSTAFVRSSGTLKEWFTDGSSSGTGATDVYSYTVPANVLGTDGDNLHAIYTISNPTSATGTITGSFAGTSLDGIGSSSFTEAKVEIDITRVSTTVARADIMITLDGIVSNYTYTELTSKDWTTTNILKLVFTASASTITARKGILIYNPKSPN